MYIYINHEMKQTVKHSLIQLLHLFKQKIHLNGEIDVV